MKIIVVFPAPSYQKPDNVDVVKLCVVQSPASQHSFVKHLKGDTDKSKEILETLSLFKISERFKTNIVECDEVRGNGWTAIWLMFFGDFIIFYLTKNQL